ncbi:hypothetical protein [Paenibacillus sp. RC84]|uniref:hypothetical protein n=1 Tax=Paenibacillus sp. RC84 TaxID=3156252 RepID=UPI003517A546
MNKKTGAKSASVKKRRTAGTASSEPPVKRKAGLKKASGSGAVKSRRAGAVSRKGTGGRKKSAKAGRGKRLRKKRPLSASGRRRTAVDAAYNQAFNEGYDSGFQAGFSQGVADGEHIPTEAAAG